MNSKNIEFSQTGLKFLDLFFEDSKLLAHLRSLLHRHGDAVGFFRRARRVSVVVFAIRHDAMDACLASDTAAGPQMCMVSDANLSTTADVIAGRHRSCKTNLRGKGVMFS